MNNERLEFFKQWQQGRFAGSPLIEDWQGMVSTAEGAEPDSTYDETIVFMDTLIAALIAEIESQAAQIEDWKMIWRIRRDASGF